MQETLTSALQAQLRDPGAARGWLFAVCGRKAIDVLRARQRRQRARRTLREGGPETAQATSELALSRERDARLRQAVADLPSPYREALELRYLQGLSFAELATRLGTNERTARTWVGRGLQRLRARLGETR